jgi:nucleoside-diphosphate-sugar epimerase
MKKKILLTGATGFIGSRILNFLLEREISVYALVRKKKRANLTKRKNLSVIYYKNYEEIKKKLSKLQVNTLINCSTHYNTSQQDKEIIKMINSNILFPTLIINNLKNKIKNYVNIGSMNEYSHKNTNLPLNFYGLTKKMFEKIGSFLFNDYKVNIYNIKLFDTYGDNDKRKKIIPTIISNYENKKRTVVISQNLFLNAINVIDILEFLEKTLKGKIKPGDYCLTSGFIKIKSIIDDINKNKKINIRINYLNKENISQVTKKVSGLKYILVKNKTKQFILNKISNI